MQDDYRKKYEDGLYFINQINEVHQQIVHRYEEIASEIIQQRNLIEKQRVYIENLINQINTVAQKMAEPTRENVVLENKMKFNEQTDVLAVLETYRGKMEWFIGIKFEQIFPDMEDKKKTLFKAVLNRESVLFMFVTENNEIFWMFIEDDVRADVVDASVYLVVVHDTMPQIKNIQKKLILGDNEIGLEGVFRLNESKLEVTNLDVLPIQSCSIDSFQVLAKKLE
ncbi:hypothetical protein EIN_169200 [Entamoeba invadens IP1]|uniref:Uncharacterized protein n=1 Tax=Entamoeba invadens IP1 TaxID=370355 RepID=A0A0A1TY81_ENTIV|nr:hypothetical protein EIN_169200 [Entamoeba invadens IP1]ELP84495.1 hypothetical protein EIN_169200 [Entamoeba invadens IP1]|eukprot:XP_004183841.1 hypothetical protein EIN_169200 [Entamoeba invadens IP1]